MSHFFSVDGPLMRGLSDLATLVFLNLITLVCSLPVITMGAALTTMHYCIMKMVDGEGHVLQLYLREFRGNLRTATIPWILMALLGCFIGFDYWIVIKQGAGASWTLIPIYLLAVLWLALFVWILPLGAKFVYSTGATFRNAALVAVGKAPRTLIMMAFTVVIPVVLVLNMRLYPILFVLGCSLPAYLCSFFYYPVIQELIEIQEKKRDGEKQ